MEDKKITIFDVARKAGVSKGTVDRVLHNRGEVSSKSAEKVRKAIEELGYEPNLYASLLATKKNKTIALISPTFSEGEYWGKIYEGFQTGGEAVAMLNVAIETFLYDQYDRDSFIEACRRLLESEPDGVVLPPLFKSDTLSLVEELKSRGIPYVYVDTKLEDDAYLAYYGMPMFKSGYFCAALLTARCRTEEVDEAVIVRIKRDKGALSDPTLERRNGFLDYMNTFFPECHIHHLFIDPAKPKSINSTLKRFKDEHPGIKYVVMFNSRVHLISDFLSKHPDRWRRVIGFDDLDGNKAALRSGSVEVLISQHTAQQSAMAVQTLSDYILMHKVPANRDCYMHMDVLTKMNLEYY